MRNADDPAVPCSHSSRVGRRAFTRARGFAYSPMLNRGVVMAEVIRPAVFKVAALALLALAFFTPAGASNASELPDPWEMVEVPEGNKVAFSVYAEGVQIYR